MRFAPPPFHPLPLLVAALLLVTCRPDEDVTPEPQPLPLTTGTLKVVVRPTWDGAPFVMNQVYTNVSNYRVKVEGIKFYLGDIQLSNGGTSTLARDIAYFDLHNNGDTVICSGIQPGNWSGLSAGLGVPAALNDADPLNYPPGHPLDLALGTYWTWATAYRFLQFDGRYDVNASATVPPASPFSMHTGLNACYQEFELPLNGDLVITAGGTTTLVLEMAVDRFFYSDAGTVDLATENQTHGTNLPLAQKLTNNVVHSISAE